jgi:hypothetical protein
MSSPIARLIDAVARCLCCRELRDGCRCHEGPRCGVCRKCATHCSGRPTCDRWWLALEADLERLVERDRVEAERQARETLDRLTR